MNEGSIKDKSYRPVKGQYDKGSKNELSMSKDSAVLTLMSSFKKLLM